MSKKVKATSKLKTKSAPTKKSAKGPSKPSKAAVKKSAPSKPAKKTSKPVVKTVAKKTTVQKSTGKKPTVVAKKATAKKVKPAVVSVKTVKSVVVKKAVAEKVDKKKSKPVNNPPAVKAKVKTEVPASKSTIEKPLKTSPDKAKKNSEALENKQNAVREVLAINNTIPSPAIDSISASRIASISSSITNAVRRTDSYSVKMEQEPSGKFEMEFVVHASAEMLYEFISTASGLSEWFCDDLNIRNGIYTFIWEDQMQQARLLKTVENQLVRFQWVDKSDGSYFEFRIQKDDLTNDISLIVTDFGDSHGDRESSKLLWNSQIEKLLHVIGSVF